MSQDAGVPPAGTTTAWAAPARGVVVGVDGSHPGHADEPVLVGLVGLARSVLHYAEVPVAVVPSG